MLFRSGETIVTIITGIIVMITLTLFVNKTKTGHAMLAVSEDKGAASLMGINVNRTIALTFAIGSALAAIAGVLLCSAYPTLSPYTGAMPGIKAFVAAVFGGIGSIPGAMIGGILLGIIEIFGKAYISSQMADAIVFAVLIIVLLVKPTESLFKDDGRAECPTDRYYVQMEVAWYFATALAKQWDAAFPYIKGRKFSAWTHAKTIQKACESYRITAEQKEILRKLK